MIRCFEILSRYCLLASLLFAPLMSAIVKADDSTAPTSKPTEQTSKPDPDKKPQERSLLQKLGDDLLQPVDDTPGASSAPTKADNVDKMDRTVKGMRTAGGKLDEGLTTEETQKIQKQVIKDLEDIINQLENPPPNPNPNGGGGGGAGGGGGGGGGGNSSRNRRGGGGSSQSQSGRSQKSGRRGTSAGQQQQNPENSDEKSGGQQSEHAKDSSAKSQTERKAAEEAARRRKLEMDIWGHLPVHLREELLSTYGERMLPKYEQMVKQFYESLSTQSDPKKK